MKQKDVFKKIGGIIQELSDQYEYLKTVPDELNELELELFVSNAHFLTDHIEILCKLNQQNHKPKTSRAEKLEAPAEHKYFEPVVQHKPKEEEIIHYEPFAIIEHEKEDRRLPAETDLSEPEPADTYTFLGQEPETIRHELVLDENINWEDEENSPVEAAKPVLNGKTKAEPVIMADTTVVIESKPADTIPGKVDQEVITINQKISTLLGDKAQPKASPVADLKLAITLNDKLMYVKDLFNGYNLAYSEAIEILNRFNTFDEAMRFLRTNYVTKNQWDNKPETTEKFYELLKRRYS